ncbi:MAG: ankyrin repeat domain-containing protein [Planctomycetota bacterium]|nr:ankyrin repeat domain-containing protein [Planctomycetota bacterium]
MNKPKVIFVGDKPITYFSEKEETMASGAEKYVGDFLKLVKTGSLAEILDAIEAGASVNAKDEYGTMPLHSAATSNRNPEVIAALVKAGLTIEDVSARNGGGNTPLHQAARYNQNSEIIAALVKAGADVNAENKNGATPLHRAARYNHNPAVITALIEAGANVKAENKNGATPLHQAAKNHQKLYSEFTAPEIIYTLIYAGALVNANTNNGKTPLKMAIDNKNTAAAQALRYVGGKEDEVEYEEDEDDYLIPIKEVKSEFVDDDDKEVPFYYDSYSDDDDDE